MAIQSILPNIWKDDILATIFRYWTYNWMKKIMLIINSSVFWLAAIIFDHTKLKIFKSLFIFLQAILIFKMSYKLTQFVLRYSWFKKHEIWLIESSFDNTQLKKIHTILYVSWTYTIKVKSWFINFFLRYRGSENPVISLAGLWLKKQNSLRYAFVQAQNYE